MGKWRGLLLGLWLAGGAAMGKLANALSEQPDLCRRALDWLLIVSLTLPIGLTVLLLWIMRMRKK